MMMPAWTNAHLGDGDSKGLFRTLGQLGMQELMRVDGDDRRRAPRTHRHRTNQRNGGRNRTPSTPAGDIELRIPKIAPRGNN